MDLSSRVRRNFVFGVVVALVALLSLSTASAQVGTTSIHGAVTDKTGAAIVGARVTLVSTAQSLHRETETNQAGEYEFVALPPGNYSLAVEMSGFGKFE